MQNKVKKSVGISLIVFIIIGVVFVLTLKGQTQKQIEVEHFENEMIKKIDFNFFFNDYPKPIEKNERLLVVIDAGHGGIDSGCVRDMLSEKDFNLDIAIKLKNILLSKDYRVIMTRESDIFLTKDERVQIANFEKADVFISIHQNAYENEEPHGIETWFDNSDTEKDSITLSKLIHNQTVLSTKARDRETRSDVELLITRETTMPSCIIETGYLSNPKELSELQDKNYQLKIANGIANGIELYLKPKIMYLTFDDGPSNKNTGKILDILKEKNIKATFFVIGENVLKNPELAKRIVAEGHEIGIHCNNHDYKTIYASVDSYTKDFEM